MDDQQQTAPPSTAAEKAPFEPQPNWTLVSQGAEARIWKIPPSADSDTPSTTAVTTTKTMIAKERFSKAYRHPQLDEKLTKSRCRAEGRILEKCRTHSANTTSTSIDVPQVIRTEAPVLYLEYIDGMTVREYLEEHLLVDAATNSNPESESTPTTKSADSKELSDLTTQLAKQIGSTIGTLHMIGCIHGDLTTSNMMLRQPPPLPEGRHDHPATKRAKPNNDNNNNDTRLNITLIDFGLAKNTTSAEERAVDLYVLERALTSTHPHLPSAFFETLLQAYKSSLEGQHKAEATLSRLEQVRLRGRKRECFG